MRQLRQEQPVASALKHKQYAACLGVCGAYLHVMVELLLRCRFVQLAEDHAESSFDLAAIQLRCKQFHRA